MRYGWYVQLVIVTLQYREKLLVGADQLREIRDEFQHQVPLLPEFGQHEHSRAVIGFGWHTFLCWFCIADPHGVGGTWSEHAYDAAHHD
jgi:hypothetical protein